MSYSETEKSIISLLQTFRALPEYLIYQFLPVLESQPEDEELRRRVIEFRLEKLCMEQAIFRSNKVYSITPTVALDSRFIDPIWVMYASLGQYARGIIERCTLLGSGRLAPATLAFRKQAGDGRNYLYYVAYIQSPEDVDDVLLLDEKLQETGSRTAENVKIIVVTQSLAVARTVPKPSFDCLVAYVSYESAGLSGRPDLEYYNCVAAL